MQDPESAEGVLERRLSDGGATEPHPAPSTEADFRGQMNEDAMATEELAEGIRGFTADRIKPVTMWLEDML